MRFKIMGKKGDAAFDYDTLEMQQVKFAELKSAGMLPMVREPSGSRLLQKFEPGVDEVIWIPRITGG